MTLKLQAGFDAIERQRRAVETLVCGLSEAALTQAAPASEWSVLMVVEHLVLSDETVGQVSGSVMSGPDPMPFRLLPRALRRGLVLAAFRRDLTLPLPSEALEPSGTILLPVLLERWKSARAAMRRALEPLRGDEPRYAHPVLGPLNAQQMLELSSVHTAYHTRQIDAMTRRTVEPATAGLE